MIVLDSGRQRGVARQLVEAIEQIARDEIGLRYCSRDVVVVEAGTEVV